MVRIAKMAVQLTVPTVEPQANALVVRMLSQFGPRLVPASTACDFIKFYAAYFSVEGAAMGGDGVSNHKTTNIRPRIMVAAISSHTLLCIGLSTR
jgi:hypothetical protein